MPIMPGPGRVSGQFQGPVAHSLRTHARCVVYLCVADVVLALESLRVEGECDAIVGLVARHTTILLGLGGVGVFSKGPGSNEIAIIF